MSKSVKLRSRVGKPLKAQLSTKDETSNLKDQVKILQGSLEKLEGQVHKTRRMFKKKLKSFMAEDKKIVKIVVASTAQQEYENSIMKTQLKTLQGSVEKLEGLHKTDHIEEKKLKEQEQKLQKSLILCYDYKETRDTLEQENSDLKDEVKTLQASVETLEGQLHETHLMHERKLKERIKIALESNAQLERKNSILMEQLKTLQGPEEKLERRLCETHETRVKLLKDTLEQDNSDLKDEVKTLHCSLDRLEEELRDTNRMLEKKLKELQKSQVLWYQSEETKDTPEQENSDLKDEVKTPQASVETVEGQVHESQRFNEEILNERDPEQQKYITLLSKYEAIKSEAQENTLNAIAEIENKKFALMKQLGILRYSLEDCATLL
ncbi:polyamine-modulated factor 1-binding protein 1 isoform X4 [Ictalurus punctatus]|uniref:Polyamine-modulated factor 1-binding protein 1 isoform X4 n=1 Tax=Ictalurus punctatus TaxID=7998 RepID=A0A2D0RFS9_ICTPU|nr:polyamine-modulated factor 1-binding protein 1 isoform X4 [Ictalurus punctatus]